ncbi:MAG: sortase [Bacilli bacterium]|nr:sortase [Bacilli bacterium]MDD4795264.1 sortase [Bacilli bacterium]
MDNLVSKRKIKVTLGVLITFIGLCIISSTYFKEKKFEVFDEMNELYYEQIVELANIPEEIDTLELPEEIDTPVIEDPEEIIEAVETVVPVPAPVIDYSKYYIGYLSIPKINLKKGFTEINSKYNNVNRNIEIIKPSKYPDVSKSNLIIASHSGSSSVSFFKDLYKLKLEDDVFITYNGTEYKYKIKNIYTDLKDGDVVIKRNKDITTLTLITCTKGDKNTQTIYICELV